MLLGDYILWQAGPMPSFADAKERSLDLPGIVCVQTVRFLACEILVASYILGCEVKAPQCRNFLFVSEGGQFGRRNHCYYRPKAGTNTIG